MSRKDPWFLTMLGVGMVSGGTIAIPLWTWCWLLLYRALGGDGSGVRLYYMMPPLILGGLALAAFGLVRAFRTGARFEDRERQHLGVTSFRHLFWLGFGGMLIIANYLFAEYLTEVYPQLLDSFDDIAFRHFFAMGILYLSAVACVVALIGARGKVFLLLPLLLFFGCVEEPMSPSAGMTASQQFGQFAVRDGIVNLAGGNLLLERTDLTLETRLGTQAIGQTYNSATGTWTWTFELRYSGFLWDSTGASYDLRTAPPGPVAGSIWSKISASSAKTRGGLVYDFGPDGKLASIHWTEPYPRINLLQTNHLITSMVQCTDANTCSTLFTIAYLNGQVTSITDRAGRVCTYARSGGLYTVRTAHDLEDSLPGTRYLAQAGRMTVTNSEGEVVTYTLDANRRVTSEQGYTFAYAADRSTRVTDPSGNATVWGFDTDGLVTSVSRPGETVSVAWQSKRPTAITKPDGTSTQYLWRNDELAAVATPSGRLISIEYPTLGANPAHSTSAIASRVSDATGTLVTRTFSPAGRVLTEKNGAGELTTFAYDSLGAMTSLTLPTGIVVQFLNYGDHGKPLEVRYGSLTNTRTFDAVGNMTSGVDPLSDTGTQWPGIVSRIYDSARNVRELVMAHDNTNNPLDVVMDYRSDGQLKAVYRPYGADEQRVYDTSGRMIERRERVDGAWQATSYTYDPAGRLTYRAQANGMIEVLGYDAAGREKHRENWYGGGLQSQIDYSYQAGRLFRSVDSTQPAPTTYHYDASGRVSKVDWPQGEHTQVSYDGRDRISNVLLLTASNTPLRSLNSHYDGADRQTALLDGSVSLAQWIYVDGRLWQQQQGNGLARTYYWDADGRSSGVLTQDRVGNVLENESITRQRTGLFQPDPQGPLEVQSVAYSSGLTSTFEQTTGVNWTSAVPWFADAVPDTGTFSFSDANQVTNYQMGATMTMTSVRHGWNAACGGAPTTIFNQNPERNRLQSVAERNPCTGADTVTHTYTWDSAGYATSRDGVPITWTATGKLASYGAATFGYDAEGRPLARYGGVVKGATIDLGFVSINLTTNAKLFRHLDYRGDVKSTSDDQGSIVSVNVYSPYRLERTEGAQTNTVGFAQGSSVGELVMLGARVYDQAAMQFLSPDPDFNAIHSYTYAQGDPIQFIDVTGRNTWGAIGYRYAQAIGGGIGAAITGAVAASSFGWGLALAPFLVTGGVIEAEAIYLFFYQIVTDEKHPAPFVGQFLLDPYASLAVPNTSGGLIPTLPAWMETPRSCGDCNARPGGPPPGARGEGDANIGSTSGLMFVPSGCGLLGIEPLLLLAALRLWRRR